MKIKLNTGQQVFFMSDPHYNHTNICRGTTKWKDANDLTRDFPTLSKMNDTIVDNINSKVGQDDILIHLGDHSFGGFEKIREFRYRLHCKNIHLILGNHDHHIAANKDNIQEIFTSVHQYLELQVIKNSGTPLKSVHDFVLFHYPITSWNNMRPEIIMLHGHCHLPPHLRIGKGKTMDVGLDGNNMSPISLNEVLYLMDKQPVASGFEFDHHIKEV